MKTLLCAKDPASHPFITKTERDFLQSEIGQLQRDNDLPPIPWKQICTSIPVIALVISQVNWKYISQNSISIFSRFLWLQMGSECMFVLLVLDLPKYMKEILKFSVHEIGFYSSITSLLSWIVSIISGFLSDFLIEKKYFTTGQARKFFTALCKCSIHWISLNGLTHELFLELRILANFPAKMLKTLEFSQKWDP